MTDDDRELVALLLAVADRLDGNGFAGTGVIRRAARVLATSGHLQGDDGCQGCGAELAYAGAGRPRRWCSETCRRKVRR